MCKWNLYARSPSTYPLSHSMSETPAILNSRRKLLGLTYEAVYERLLKYPWTGGTTAPSLAVVGHWFNGTRRPRNMQHLRGLCDVLGITIDEAIKGKPREAKTGMEQAMLEAMRGMQDVDAEMLLAMAKRMAKPQK